jgi:ATP-dependent helicase/nuclease subunit B
MTARSDLNMSSLPSLFERLEPRVFTIPPAASFLDVLAKTLLGELDRPETPFALSDAIILLPTKRAARALGQAFLDARDGAATLLPRIRTIGDIDPDDAGLAELGEGLNLTPIIEPMSRRLTLARLIRARDRQTQWSNDPVAALSAADALAELLDAAAMMAPTAQPFDWAVLDTLVDDKDLAHHWEQSTTFLKIITQVWPEYLEAQDRVDPGAKQRRGIESLIETWSTKPPKGAVILAGSTGSMPITRELMACVARLPRGCVVLPGLDTNLTPVNWNAARRDDQHPQRAMAEALEAIQVSLGDVRQWPGVTESEPLSHRRTVLNEALTPQEATSDWPSRIQEIGANNIASGLSGLCLVEAATEEEEANIIALELRETLQYSGQTGALVTPDANIARRVAAKLARWGIAIDVSAGRPLGETTIGTFIRLVTNWASDPADPVALVGLLGHPLTCAGHSRTWVHYWASCLEINLLRGARKDQDLSAMRARLETIKPKNWRALGDDTPEIAVHSIAALIDTLSDILGPTGDIGGTLDQVAQRIAGLCEALASRDDRAGAETLWRGEAGEAGAQFFAALIAQGSAFDTIEHHQVSRVLDYLLQGQVVRPRGTHPQLAILGPLEARLLRFDKIVLAGLDEGVWPKAPPPDPFLSRAMRARLGLPSPDTRIGLSAHDFAQLAAAPRVILTRAKRRNDSPAIMSRWLWRLKTLTRGALGDAASADALAPKPNWQMRLRHHEPHRVFDPSLAIPRPKPPVSARPTAFSATQIETWIRDPYRVYIEKILGLRALDPLGGAPGVSERGVAIHAATEIVGTWFNNHPRDGLQQMVDAMERHLKAAGYRGTALSRELTRLEASVAWLVPFELERLKKGWRPYVEQWGEAVLDTPHGPLKITAKSDRIDIGPLGLEVLDFKSGTPSTDRQVMTLMSAQLPATALIIARGGYPDIPALVPTDLAHIRLGGREVGLVGGVHNDTNVSELVDKVETTLIKLFGKYMDANWAYLSKPRVQFIKAANYDEPSDRLARRAEWADVEGDA